MRETEYEYRTGDTVLIQALAEGHGTGAASVRAGVSESTVRNRKLDSLFMKQVSKQRSQMLHETAGLLTSIAGDAAMVLNELINDEDMAGHVRQNACRTVLDYTIRLQENMALDDRLTELEELISQELVYD